jgi:ribonuclease BN (tRNA processing enzyme)
MKIRVLGCHGSQLPHYNTTSFLFGQNILLDAGTVTTVLSLKEQLKIDYIFITHAHLDHVRDLMFLADNICHQRKKNPLVIVSTKGIIEAIRRHLFNNIIWPDFSRIPSAKDPLIKFQIIKPGKEQTIGDFRVTAIKVHHVVETVGYVIENKNKTVIFLGDTGPTENAWQVANKIKNLNAVFIETSLPDSMKGAAAIAGHLTPSSLQSELNKLKGKKPDIYLYHIKPRYRAAISKEVAVIKDRKIHIIKDGQIIRI